ncbi:MAG: hypothetical protein ABIY52_11230, partial [Gemmatimonadaceae bacterium]
APASSSAQVPTGIASVDSASVARAAYGRAARTNDPAAARLEIDRAARAWPTQPAYVWARALLAARAGDTATAISALGDYADLSVGRDLRASPDLKSLATLPAFARVESRHAANRLPMQRSRVVATLADSSIWPEGMDHDSRSGMYYIASIQHGTVVAVTRSGAVTNLWSRDSLNVGAVLAVRVDTARNALWVTTSGMPDYEGRVPSDSTLASLLRIRLPDGKIEQRWDLPVVDRGHILGDVAIGAHGDVFFSDSNHPVVYWLKPGADVLDSIRSPLFNSAQGLAPTPDGRTLYIADYSHGLIRMDLATSQLHRVSDAPHSTTLGFDGIVWHKGSLIAIQNGIAPARVVRLYLAANGRAIERVEVIDQNPLADEPTIGTIVRNEFVYVANSQWEKRDASGKAKVRLTGPLLLGVPLK